MSGFTTHHSAYLARRIMLEGRTEEAFVKSFSAARVETKPHQVDAALFALRSPLSKGVILADEVGLGKTIEASLVMAQRWAERRRRLLLIVPAALRKQWRQELSEKFSLPSRILDSKTYQDAVKAGRLHPFDAEDAVIVASYEFAARRAADIRRIDWDLVVFDEAHRLRNVYKPSGSKRARDLRDAVKSRFKILLTATPLHNSLMELYGLVSIIDEEVFSDEKTFKTMYDGRRSDGALAALRQRIAPLCKRHLRRDVQEAGHVAFTKRMATTFDFEPSDQEVELYDNVSAYLQRPDSVAFGRPNQLVIIQARKILGSSIAAIVGFLENVLNRLRRNQTPDASTVADVDDANLAEELDEEDDGEDPSAIDPRALAAEIKEVESYLALALAIGANAKGEKLVAQLPSVLDEVQKRGGARKAVIFTESLRTQDYLFNLLIQNGYDGQIVRLNGSNADPDSRALHKDWIARPENADARSGSKSADMKAAVIDAFRDEGKTILIATESGAEGVNLQFCSLVVNFDLPWNPQKIEQRIGRCHRYGQKIDVAVVNMLNRRNVAERRVYELLNSKFRLFSGLFGASDGVLGAIESGVDFERKVVEAVQRGRTEAEVEAAFRQLEEELQDQIQADMNEARRKLFDGMDRDVVAKLRQRGDEIGIALDEFQHRLLTIVRAEAPDARFHEETGAVFDHDGRTWTTDWIRADREKLQFFRLGDGGPAQSLVDAARARTPHDAAIVFDYAAYRAKGWPKLAEVERLGGKSGWLAVSIMTVRAADPAMGRRSRLVVAGFCDDAPEEKLGAAAVDDLFLTPGVVTPLEQEIPVEKLAALDREAQEAALAQVNAENGKWLDEETEKLDAFVNDLEQAAEARIKELELEAKNVKKAVRAAGTGVSLEEKIKEMRRIKSLEAEAAELKFSVYRRKAEVRAQFDQKLDVMADTLKARPVVRKVFTMRWVVVV